MDNIDEKRINEGYKSVFFIENILRELIIEELSNYAGPKWYRSRLSEDALNSYKLGIEYEKKHDWRGFISFHPIYYIDFPCLRTTIIQKNNWTEVFSSIFENKEHISIELYSIEPIRNAIAHNRIIGDYDFSKIEGVKQYIINSIGKERSVDLATRTTAVESITNKIISLILEIQDTMSFLSECKKIKNIDHIDSIASDWWFDHDYLGFDLSNTLAYIQILRWYYGLEREIGDGYQIDKLLVTKNYDKVFKKCVDDLKTIVGDSNG